MCRLRPRPFLLFFFWARTTMGLSLRRGGGGATGSCSSVNSNSNCFSFFYSDGRGSDSFQDEERETAVAAPEESESPCFSFLYSDSCPRVDSPPRSAIISSKERRHQAQAKRRGGSAPDLAPASARATAVSPEDRQKIRESWEDLQNRVAQQEKGEGAAPPEDESESVFRFLFSRAPLTNIWRTLTGVCVCSNGRRSDHQKPKNPCCFGERGKSRSYRSS